MKVFFDTSSLFKLYHRERGTEAASALKVKSRIELFVTSDNLLSEISQLEGLPTK